MNDDDYHRIHIGLTVVWVAALCAAAYWYFFG